MLLALTSRNLCDQMRFLPHGIQVPPYLFRSLIIERDPGRSSVATNTIRRLGYRVAIIAKSQDSVTGFSRSRSILNCSEKNFSPPNENYSESQEWKWEIFISGK
jgi:hypothetical protein